MSGRLEGRRAVVTGAARGLGRAIAARFVSEGAYVVLADIEEGEGAEVTAALVEAGGKAVFTRCDVAFKSDIRSAIERSIQEWGGIDILVNNAGIAPRGDILSLDEETFDASSPST